MRPLTLFRRVAVAEAITWALLLVGMVLKYATDTTEVGVQIAGPVHGVVFIAYCLTTLLVAVDQRWTPGRTLLGLASSIPPFFTLLFDYLAEKRGAFAGSWRLTAEEPARPLDRPVAWLLRNPLQGALVAVGAVAVLTVLALVAGPPASS